MLKESEIQENMVNPESKKAQLLKLLPAFEGLTLKEAAERIGLSPATMKHYLYELGGAVVGLEGGKIHMNEILVAAATQEGERHVVRHLHPAFSPAEQSRRRGPASIQAGGLSVSSGRINFGAESGVWAINAFQVGVEELSERDDEEILRRIEQEGTTGTGERLG